MKKMEFAVNEEEVGKPIGTRSDIGLKIAYKELN